MLEDMSAELANTDPLVMLVAGVVVRPSPISEIKASARTIKLLACSKILSNHITMKSRQMASRPSGMMVRAAH